MLLCKCGCGGIPKLGSRFIHGHNAKALRIPLETRYCECHCDETFTCKENSKQRFINEHYARTNKTSLETRICKCNCGGTFICKEDSEQRFINGHNGRIPVETRICDCGCKETFTCKVTSDQRFIDGHNNKCMTQEIKDKKGKASRELWKDSKYREFHLEVQRAGYTIEVRKKIKKFHKSLWEDPKYRKKQIKAHLENWKDPKYKEKQLKAMLDGCSKSPNEQEKTLFNIVGTLFPNEYLLNTNGEHVRLEDKKPDIVNIKEKKLIEHQGDYWHANPDFCKREGIKFIDSIPVETIRRRDKLRFEAFAKLGWDTLIVWEHELQDTTKLEEKLSRFCG